MTATAIEILTVPSPIGPLRLTAENGAITGIDFGAPGNASDHEPAEPVSSEVAPPEPAEATQPVLAEAARQLDAYFSGESCQFDFPLRPHGTPFQLDVWRALRDIPYGETISYSELAQRIGRPGASRAVGRANGQNPIAIVVPCHRVIGADGTLTGYAGGLDVKARLLSLEASGTV